MWINLIRSPVSPTKEGARVESHRSQPTFIRDEHKGVLL